jgi:hypothetical protein
MTMPLGSVTGSVEASLAAASPVEMTAAEAPRLAKAEAFRKSRRDEFELFIFSETDSSRFSIATLHRDDIRPYRCQQQVR